MTVTPAQVRQAMRDRAMSAEETTRIFAAQDSQAALSALGIEKVEEAVAYIATHSPDRIGDFEVAREWLSAHGFEVTRAVAAGLGVLKRDSFPK